MLEGVDISFETLATENGLDELEKIYNMMDGHLKDCENYYGNNNEIRNNGEYLEGILNFKKMKETFLKGINLLKDKPKVFKSFLLMNKSFQYNSKDKQYNSWRLFQIVFIVSELIDVVDKDAPKKYLFIIACNDWWRKI